ncbi:glycosyl hydrolase [Mycetocola saprophilus]|uniref:glycosyl hydrolase n=1 Tax=Mycetocola saprophilus TaxID=76636 RepID=UPI003BF0AC4C
MKLSRPPVRRLSLGVIPLVIFTGGIIASPAIAAPEGKPGSAAGALPRIAAAAPAPRADGIPVGSGSIAAAPPASLGQDVQNTLNQKIWIDQSLTGTPVPTNSWWSDLVVSTYSGDLWADPLVLSNSAEGTLVRDPRKWNADGTAMVLADGVRVGGQVAPQPDASDRVLADFEDGLPAGWTATGTAFDRVSTGTSPGQSPVSGWLGKGFLNSFTAEQGDGATGSLRSPDFTIDRNALVAKIGGGNHPGLTELRVVVNGQSVATATGEDSETLTWKTLDLTPWVGQNAHIEIVDELTAGWAHLLVDHVMLTNKPDGLDDRFGTAFRAANAVATGWGDWNVDWRLDPAAGPSNIAVSAARGVPYTWFRFNQVTPELTVGENATFTKANGDALTFPATTDRLVIRQGDSKIGVHAPEGTTFERSGNRLIASVGTGYLVLSALPDSGFDLNTLHRYAFARVTGTTMAYQNHTDSGEVRQDWALTTEPLQGTETSTIQGWLPHQYREAKRFEPTLTGTTYKTPRGEMRTSIGRDGWKMAYTFEGMTPITGAPESKPGAPAGTDYEHAVMAKFLRDYAAKTTYGNDTYWGGKDVIQLGEYMLVAKQLGETESYETLRSTLRTALSDWFTYTEGEESRFFARYDTWKALVGFSESYGSSQFTDNHFHYGYFTAAAAMLAMEDPEWAAGYGDVATLVAQQYGNWDRSSQDYPYLRTFDTWSGFSYAGGFSSPGGNNQESSSEAIQSWAGLYLLGVALGNQEMRDTGAMGYVTERAAIREYWLNTGGVFPEQYKHSTSGIVFDSGQAFATYFSGDPAWIYGIQWLPTAPWLNYLGWDRTAATKLLDDMFALRPDNIGGEGTRAGNKAGIQTFAKQWWGIGTYGDIQITEDRESAVNVLKNIVRDSEKHNPGYTTRKVAANPLFDPATNSLLISVDASGTVVFPDEHWTPATLPAKLIPHQYTGAMVDADPATWTPVSPLLAYFSTDFQANQDAIDSLYRIKVAGYTPGRDTAAATAVISGMGDALGQVVLGQMAQSHPEIYADIFAELRRTNDPMVSAVSMAGMVYYNAMANRNLGIESRDHRVGADLAQVYKNPDTGVYSYVVTNPTDTQQRYPAYNGSTRIGWIDVPAHSQVTHRLDAKLKRIELVATPDATTITPGSTLALSAVGYDQYGATVDIPNLEWTANRGGNIGADGVFHATTATEKATITATSGSVKATRDVRVGEAPVLTSLRVTPGPVRIAPNSPVTFSAAGLDQYGDAFALADTVTWTTTVPGSITAAGVLTATSTGSGLVRASAQSGGTTLAGSAVVAVSDPSIDIARGVSVSATSQGAEHVAAHVVDGNPATRWESTHGLDDQSITLDLGASYDLSGVKITWEAAAAARYRLEIAQNENGPYEPLITVAKSTAAPDELTLTGTGRYLRLQGIERLLPYGYSIHNFEVFGTRSAQAITPSALYLLPETSVVSTGREIPLTVFGYDAAGAGGALSGIIPTLSGPGEIRTGAQGTPVFVAQGPGEATITVTHAGKTATATVLVR